MGSNLSRPSITAAQVAGLAMGAVPIVAQLLHVFGVYTLSGEQESSLRDAIQWGVVTAGTLFAADAGLRAARNHAHAKVESQRVFAATIPEQVLETPSTEAPPAAPTPPAAPVAPIAPKSRKPRPRKIP